MTHMDEFERVPVGYKFYFTDNIQCGWCRKTSLNSAINDFTNKVYIVDLPSEEERAKGLRSAKVNSATAPIYK